jgi:hypothetical protein
MLDAAVRFCHALLLQSTAMYENQAFAPSWLSPGPKAYFDGTPQVYAVEDSPCAEAQLSEQVCVMEKLD